MARADMSLLDKQSAANTIHRMKESLGLNFTEIAKAIGVHRNTVYRYHKLESVPSKKVLEQLVQIREITQLLSEVLVNENAQREWLCSTVPLLGDQRPIDLIREGEFNKVRSVLAGLNSGVFL
jgi:predicted transcriptional regulator